MGEGVQKEYQCQHCGKVFNSYRSLNGHIARCKNLQHPCYTEDQLQCKFCGRVCKNLYGKSRHEQVCDLNPNKRTNIVGEPNEEYYICQFCGKQCKNHNSLINHERLCKSNPNRQLTSYEKYGPVEGFNKMGRTAWNKGLNKYTNEIIYKYSLKLQQMFKDGLLVREQPKWTDEIVQKMLLNRSKNRVKSRYKFGWYDGIPCDSGWELAFVLYNKDIGKQVFRCNESFPYYVDKEEHRYIPDFIIDGIYYEIKGQDLFYTQYKIGQFPKDKQIILLCAKEMYPILKYVKEKYGKDFAKLYDRSMPSWMDVQDKLQNGK